MNGYAGTILRIDLSRDHVEQQPLPPQMAREFIGGRGFIAKILFDQLPPGMDAYAPQNMLHCRHGALERPFYAGQRQNPFRHQIAGNRWLCRQQHGRPFRPGSEICRLRLLVLTGMAEAPSYLFIDDDRVEIRRAESLLGPGRLERRRAQLKRIWGKISRSSPSGRPVKKECALPAFRTISAARPAAPASAPCWGQKTSRPLPFAAPAACRFTTCLGPYEAGARRLPQRISDKPGFKGWTPEGTAGITNWINEVGVFPTRNFPDFVCRTLPANQRQGHYRTA